MIRVVVADITDNSGRDLSVEKSILGPDIELVLHSCNGNEKLLISGCLDADVVLTDFAPLKRAR